MNQLRRMFRYLKPYKASAVLIAVFIIFEVAADLIQPVLMTKVLDNGLATGNIQYVFRIGAIMIAMAFFGAIIGIINTKISAKTAMNFGADIRSDLFKKVHSLSAKNLDKFKAGKLITRLTNDVTMVQMIVYQLLRTFVRAPFLLIGALFLAFTTSPKLALVLVCVIPVMFIGLAFILMKAFPYFSKMQGKLDDVNSVLIENTAGVRVVKAFVTEKYENKRFNKTNTDYMDMAIKAQKIMSFATPIIMLTVFVGQSAILYFGGNMVIGKTLEISAIMAMINYLMQVLMALMMVSIILMTISRAEASAGRINEVMDEEPVIVNSDSASKDVDLQGNVTFNHVNFGYGEGHDILKDLNFEVHSGETIGIIGATGSGKSSLVKLLPRIYDTTSGDILLDGKPIKDIDLESLRQQIGFVTQKAIVFSGTIADNILQGKQDATIEEMEDAAMKAQAFEYISKLDAKYEHQLNQMGTNLSGGQKQRLSLTRAFVRKPAILVLDDSTSAVDAHSEEKIQEGLKKMPEETTVFIIAQKISSLLEADKIIVLDDHGKMNGFGNHKELLKSSEVYRDIYRSQYGEEALTDVE